MGAIPAPLARIQAHPVRLSRPWFAGSGGTTLHRYLDDDFIPRFLTDLAAGRLADPALSDWWRTDRFGAHDRRLILRLPVHRTYYLAVCEAVCDRPGHPALDPGRIASAGFVIRRVGEGSELAWMLEDGEPLGWLPTPGEDRDPDLGRRLCRRGGYRADGTGLAFSGEETHPLHPVLARDLDGRMRTLLYGFLPLGGQSLPRGAPFDAAAGQEAVAEDRRGLPWPFGYPGSNPPAWQQGRDGLQVVRGVPTAAFAMLLRLLVNRYHLGETPSGEGGGVTAQEEPNGALAVQARQTQFVDPHSARPLFSLWDYLESCFATRVKNPLVDWSARLDRAINAAGGIGRLGTPPTLPSRPLGAPVPGATLNGDLSISSADAQEWRDLLGARLLDQARRSGSEVPRPKFGQGLSDLYQVVPFVRTRDESGFERLTWAGPVGRSATFGVAAPFDPDASRPSVIQMPGLRDLRRGLAKGASMIIPPDTMDLIGALKMDEGASKDAVPDPAPGPQLGIQWICSFSLPVITLVAMILLMIMIALLNILFFWLPWVRICLPFPKLK